MTLKNPMNGGEVIVDYLVREGVPYVFGLCGHGIIGFMDALYDRREIKTVSVHHESVAGFMADVFYRVSGKATATFTSCGPGSGAPRRPDLAARWPFSTCASRDTFNQMRLAAAQRSANGKDFPAAKPGPEAAAQFHRFLRRTGRDGDFHGDHCPNWAG